MKFNRVWTGVALTALLLGAGAQPAFADKINLQTGGAYTIYTNSPEAVVRDMFPSPYRGYYTLHVDLERGKTYVAESYHHNQTGTKPLGYDILNGYVLSNNSKQTVTIQILQEGRAALPSTDDNKIQQSVNSELQYYNNPNPHTITIPAGKQAFLSFHAFSPGNTGSIKVKFKVPEVDGLSLREFIATNALMDSTLKAEDVYNSNLFKDYSRNDSDQSTGLFPYSEVRATIDPHQTDDFTLGGMGERKYIGGRPPIKPWTPNYNPGEYQPAIMGMLGTPLYLHGNFGIEYQLKFQNANGYKLLITPYVNAGTRQKFIFGTTKDGWWETGFINKNDEVQIPADGLLKYVLPGGDHGSVNFKFVDIQPPSKPVLTAEQKGENIELKWSAATDNSNSVQYRVYQDGKELDSVRNTTFTVRNLTSGKTYNFKVVAYDKDGNSTESQLVPVNYKNSSDTIPPSKTKLTFSKVTCTEAVLEWTEATDNVGVVRYNVFVDGDYVDSTTKSRSYKLENLSPNTTYRVKVRALDAKGNYTDSDTEVLRTDRDREDPTKPELDYDHVTDSSVDITWTKSKDNVGVDRYNVFVDGEYYNSTVSSRSMTVDGLDPNKTYRIKVRAVDKAGNYADSNTVSVRTKRDSTPPTKPELSVDGKGTTYVILSWSRARDNVGVTQYNIFNGSSYVDSTETARSYKVTGLTPGRTYTFKVRAKDAEGNYTDSNTVTVTTAR